jgi:hypothetical protein
MSMEQILARARRPRKRAGREQTSSSRPPKPVHRWPVAARNGLRHLLESCSPNPAPAHAI